MRRWRRAQEVGRESAGERERCKGAREEEETEVKQKQRDRTERKSGENKENQIMEDGG